MAVRRAEKKDIPAILKLLVQVNMVHHNGRPDLFNGPATKYTENELRELLKDDTRPVFVCTEEIRKEAADSENDTVCKAAAEDDAADTAVGSGRVLGHAFCIFQQHIGDNILTDVKTLYIDDICVDENARHQHVGSQLYEHVLQFAREQGCYNVTLNVWECNPGARAFYEAQGMVPYKTGMEVILDK